MADSKPAHSKNVPSQREREKPEMVWTELPGSKGGQPRPNRSGPPLMELRPDGTRVEVGTAPVCRLPQQERPVRIKVMTEAEAEAARKAQSHAQPLSSEETQPRRNNK